MSMLARINIGIGSARRIACSNKTPAYIRGLHSAMASLPDVRIDAKDAPRLAFSVPDITDAQASKLSRLLTENHQRHREYIG